MKPQDYVFRREAAGPQVFYLIDFWIKDGFFVDELTKNKGEENIVSVNRHLVQEIDPEAENKMATSEEHIEWEWDDTVAINEPISRSRSRLDNEREMRRVDQQLQNARSKRESIPEGVELGGKVEADIEYLKRVKGRFWQWFYEAGMEPPTTEDSSDSLPSGFEYAERLYDYLDLDNADPENVQYTELKQLYEAASDESPEHFIVSYNGLYSALKDAGFYRSSSSNTTQSRKDNLVEMCKRIIRYVENGDRPDTP